MDFEAYHTPDADPEGPPNAVRAKALTLDDEAFCQLYAKSGNGSRSYVVAFEYAGAHRYALSAAKLRQPRIKARIEEIREQARRRLSSIVGVTAPKIAQMFLEIAMTDPNELIGLRIGCCRHCHGDGHGYQWKEHEYLDALEKWEALPVAVQASTAMPAIGGGLGFDHTAEPDPECPNCMGEGLERVVARDTTQLSDGAKMLFQGVKQTRNGLEIQMADRAKALEMAARIAGFLKDGQNVQVNATGNVSVATNDPAAAQAAYEAMIAAS